MEHPEATTRTLEEHLYVQARSWRGYMVRPLVLFFSALGMSANAMSYVGLALTLASAALMPTHLHLSFIVFCIALLADNLDGELARHQGTASDRGKFTDVVVDNVTFSIFMFGVAYAGILDPLLAGVVVYTMLLCRTFMVVRKNVHKKSDWLIKAYAGFFPNFWVYVHYSAFIGYALGYGNILPIVATLSAIALSLKAVIDFRFIQRTIFIA